MDLDHSGSTSTAYKTAAGLTSAHHDFLSQLSVAGRGFSLDREWGHRHCRCLKGWGVMWWKGDCCAADEEVMLVFQHLKTP